ncbi:nuclear envelope integral membrane protein 1-like isoform X2 [Chelmon rostratus]|uniref:nuclear envelope integral membrane protein 1-like isoform X2 n=1 Tax=Chelmon rostratus TaxID=109905 RepID=UPI001BEAFF1E|nr:nuclear envelope integral membrane protein 1-like isoform X2 [Chelmon rostratus]
MAGCMKMMNGFISTSAKLMVFMVLLTCLPQALLQETGNKHPVIDLQDGGEYVLSGSNRFCYKNNVVPTWRQTWTRIQVKVWSSNVFKVEIVEGEEDLQELDRFSFWSWFQSLLRERHNETTINISLFNKKKCFKIDPADKTQYTIKPLRKFDIYMFLVFLAGMLLFIFAGSLSRSQVFFYSAGMSTGMIASLIILFFILARFLPKKSPFYVLIVGGWSFSVYAIQLVCRNLGVILREHWHVALGYVAVVGFISFAVCYRYGPLADEKNINILSWTLQLFGLLLIYLGVQIQQVAFAIIVAALLSKNLEYPVILVVVAWRKIRQFVHWKPEPRRLLTEEEYQKQGEEETQRALEELRKYCNSPEFSPWKAVSRLQSPKRFADFIEGSPHLMPNEVSVHVQEYGFGGSFFEDELFDTDDEEDDMKPPTMKPE